MPDLLIAASADALFIWTSCWALSSGPVQNNFFLWGNFLQFAGPDLRVGIFVCPAAPNRPESEILFLYPDFSRVV